MNGLLLLLGGLCRAGVDSAALPPSAGLDSLRSPGASVPADPVPDAAPATDSVKSSGDTAVSGPRERGDGVFVGKTVVVKGKRVLHRQKEASKQVITGEDARKVVATMGDPMRAVNTLPGVAVESDFSVRPVVRGGRPEETRVFLDGVSLLQPWHFTASASVFHPEATGQLKLHTGAFPVEGAGSLSGALYAQSRPAPVDSLRGVFELSMLKGSLYVGAPVVKGKAGAYVAAQTFWYDFVFKRLVDLGDVFGQSSSDADELKESTSLPTFRDLQWGTDVRLSDGLSLHYTGYWGRDVLRFQERNEYWQTDDGHLVSTWRGRQEDLPGRTVALIDTQANVEVNNHVHLLRLPWEISHEWMLTPLLAFQWQSWDVDFPDGRQETLTSWGYEYVRKPSTARYFLRRDALDAQVELASRSWEGHQASAGIGLRREEQTYSTRMERPLAEFLIKGSRNLSDMLGLYDSRGYVLTTAGFLGLGGDARTELVDGIRYDYEGRQERTNLAGWIGDVWDPRPDLRVRAGTRLERDGGDGGWFLSPRGSAQWQVGERDELTLSTGLYSQASEEFETRVRNPELTSEKSLHGGLEWSHDFDRSWRFELQAYAKSYWDLAAPRLSVESVDWDDLPWSSPWNGLVDSSQAALVDSLLRSRARGELQAYYQGLDAQGKAAVELLLGRRVYIYRNTGSGFALGAEASLSYDPVPWWRGWVSAGISTSKRRDADGEPLYPFAQDRPWTFHWVNSFHMPSRYVLDLHWSAWAGLPWTYWNDDRNCQYSTVDGFACSDTLLVVGPRNGRRYAPYQRLDIRLSKESTFFGFPSRTSFEVWNALNAPNFLLRDSETERIQMVDLNVPVPVVFLGWEVRF